MTRLPVRLGIQQRILPAYRVPFFDMLAGECEGGLSLFAGDPLPGEGVITGEPSISRVYHANNRRLPFNLGGALWQTNILDWVKEWDSDILIFEANPRTRTTSAAIRAVKSRGGASSGGDWARRNSTASLRHSWNPTGAACFSRMTLLSPIPRPEQINMRGWAFPRNLSSPPAMRLQQSPLILPRSGNQPQPPRK